MKFKFWPFRWNSSLSQNAQNISQRNVKIFSLLAKQCFSCTWVSPPMFYYRATLPMEAALLYYCFYYYVCSLFPDKTLLFFPTLLLKYYILLALLSFFFSTIGLSHRNCLLPPKMLLKSFFSCFFTLMWFFVKCYYLRHI